MLPSITSPASQCGFGAYCVNSKCTLLYSIAVNTDTAVPSATS